MSSGFEPKNLAHPGVDVTFQRKWPKKISNMMLLQTEVMNESHDFDEQKENYFPASQERWRCKSVFFFKKFLS